MYVYAYRWIYLPTKFSSTELLPADCPPTTAICGRSNVICTPSDVKASCSRFTMGISCPMPWLPDILAAVGYALLTPHDNTPLAVSAAPDEFTLSIDYGTRTETPASASPIAVCWCVLRECAYAGREHGRATARARRCAHDSPNRYAHSTARLSNPLDYFHNIIT